MSKVLIGRAEDLGILPREVQDFYTRHWQRQIALSNPFFYQWQFLNKPCNTGIDECVVAISADQIAGVMGVNSRAFSLKGNLYPGAELTTWVVSEDHRGKGIGPAIIQNLQSQYYVLAGTGITSDALSIYLRSGFHYIRYIPRFVRVYDTEQISDYAYIEPLAAKLIKQRLKLSSVNEYKVFSPCSDDWDALFKKFAERNNVFDRSSPWIEWRYSHHPHFKYEMTALRGSAYKSVVMCWRTDVLPNGAKILRILDIVGDVDMYPAALAYIDQYCNEAGCSLADFFCTSSSVRAVMAVHGWFSTLDEPFFKFPHLFAPIELRDPATTSLIIWSRCEQSSILNMSNLYITKQDCDLDRPTMEDLTP